VPAENAPVKLDPTNTGNIFTGGLTPYAP
jgi:hypothetical protein